jgi:hypothetical protein
MGPATGCAGNQVSGNLQVQNNTASTTIDSNTVGGNLMDQGNTAATQVFTNVISGRLSERDVACPTVVILRSAAGVSPAALRAAHFHDPRH